MSEQKIMFMREAMRAIAAAVIICGSTMTSFSDEAYVETGKLLGGCLGQELKKAGGSYAPAETMDQYLLLRCGYLEERQEKEFMDFLQARLARPLNSKEQAELAATIFAELLVEHTRGGLRRALVDIYKKTILDSK
jgi:hypothetical protein